MSIETAVVFNYDMEPIFWHLPEGRTVGSIPDSRLLWDVLMEHKDDIFGVAHSHPGSGMPGPSWTDVTTFSSCELGLARDCFGPLLLSIR